MLSLAETSTQEEIKFIAKVNKGFVLLYFSFQHQKTDRKNKKYLKEKKFREPEKIFQTKLNKEDETPAKNFKRDSGKLIITMGESELSF